MIRFGRDLATEAGMAGKDLSVKKYVVRLSAGEREHLQALIRKGKSPAKRLLEEGFAAVVSRKRRMTPPVAAICDGEKEAKLIALACSEPPKGRARWTLRLLESKVVELGIVERASDSTIGRTLKKTVSSRIAGNAGSSRRRPTAPS